MTDPNEAAPMSRGESSLTPPRWIAQKAGFSAICELTARRLDETPATVDHEDGSLSEREYADWLAHGLRRLAVEIGRLEQHLPPMPAGMSLTALGAREFITASDALDFAAFCAAGFAPGEEGGR